jgi:hypothetical protein
MLNLDLNKSFRTGHDSVFYFASDLDKTSDPKYYGFIDYRGTWFIIRENQALGQFRYAKGKTDYTTNWTNRAALTYGYIYEVA